MNTKVIITITISVLFLAAAIYVVGTEEAPTDGLLNDEQVQEEPAGDVLIVSGEITELDKSQIAFDGPYRVILESAAGESQTVEIPSMGINLCEARENITEFSNLAVGDEIEARGTQGSSGAIALCSTPDDYLRVDTAS